MFPPNRQVAQRPDGPGVRFLWRGGSHGRLPALRDEAVRDVCSELGVPSAEVWVRESTTVDGHLRIHASWTPS